MLSLTVETDTPNAVPGSTVEINGLKWHIVEKGSSSPTPTSHPNGAIGIQKLEHNPVEAWDTLRQLVHTVLPPPRQAFKNKNPSGDDQHVACAHSPEPPPRPPCGFADALSAGWAGCGGWTVRRCSRWRTGWATR